MDVNRDEDGFDHDGDGKWLFHTCYNTLSTNPKLSTERDFLPLSTLSLYRLSHQHFSHLYRLTFPMISFIRNHR